MATQYITPEQYADSLGVSRQLVYKWISEGRLKATPMLGRLAIREGVPRPKKQSDTGGRPRKTRKN